MTTRLWAQRSLGNQNQNELLLLQFTKTLKYPYLSTILFSDLSKAVQQQHADLAGGGLHRQLLVGPGYVRVQPEAGQSLLR